MHTGFLQFLTGFKMFTPEAEFVINPEIDTLLSPLGMRRYIRTVKTLNALPCPRMSHAFP